MARITAMALGTLSRQVRFEGPAELLGERLRGVYQFLADHGDVLFPDGYFADLSAPRGALTYPLLE